MDNTVLHLSLIDYENHQYPVARKGQKLHLAQLIRLLTRHGDQTRLSRNIGQ